MRDAGERVFVSARPRTHYPSVSYPSYSYHPRLVRRRLTLLARTGRFVDFVRQVSRTGYVDVFVDHFDSSAAVLEQRMLLSDPSFRILVSTIFPDPLGY